jgi:hypothetical protein
MFSAAGWALLLTAVITSLGTQAACAITSATPILSTTTTWATHLAHSMATTGASHLCATDILSTATTWLFQLAHSLAMATAGAFHTMATIVPIVESYSTLPQHSTWCLFILLQLATYAIVPLLQPPPEPPEWVTVSKSRLKKLLRKHFRAHERTRILEELTTKFPEEMRPGRKRRERHQVQSDMAAFMAELESHSDNRLYLDSGATIDVEIDRNNLTGFEPSEGSCITTAKSGASIPILGTGTRRQGTITTPGVRYAPQANKRLASVGQLCDQNNGTLQVLFTADTFEVRSTPCTCNCTVEALGSRTGSGMYAFAQEQQVHAASDDLEADPNLEIPNDGDHTRTAIEGGSNIQQPQAIAKEKIFPPKHVMNIHRSHGHMSLSMMKRMVHAGSLRTSQKTASHLLMCTHLNCDDCLAGKAQRAPVKQIDTKVYRVGERLMADIRGPFQTTSRQKHVYYLNIVDAGSKYVHVVGLTNKHEAMRHLLNFVEFATKQGHNVQYVQSDQDKAIIDKETEKTLEARGIKVEQSPPYIKELNGAPESNHKFLNGAIKTSLHQSGLPPTYWEHALLFSNFVKNRIGHWSLPATTNPWTQFFQKLRNHQPLIPFGCSATPLRYAHKDGGTRAKDEMNVGEECIIVGYAPKGGYVLLRQNQTTIIRYAPDVTFKVDRFPYLDWTRKNSKKPKVTSDPPIQRTKRTRHPPQRMADEVPLKEQLRLLRKMETDLKKGPHKPAQAHAVYEAMTAALTESSSEPTTHPEAINGPESTQWGQAITSELNSHKENGTWTACKLPPGRKAIGCKWVFKVKRDENGNVERYKARLTAKGYSQIRGVDYNETFAPTVRFTTIRMFFAIAAHLGWSLMQLDVKTAYLIPKLKQEIYMKAPEGSGMEGGYVRLNKCLYGLKQSGRAWNDNLHSTLTQKLGLKRSKFDPCLYYSLDKHGNLSALLVCYVDDILLCGSTSTIENLSSKLLTAYKMTSGKVSHFLAMRISQNQNGDITLQQDAFVDKLLARFNMTNAAATRTPGTKRLSKEDCPTTTEEKEYMQKVPYRQCVGALMYLAVLTRPDIVFAVNQASRFLENPGRAHWAAVKTIMTYLKGTRANGLTFKANNPRSPRHLTAEGFSDADWAGNPDDRRSCSGYLFTLGGGLISWKSKKQPCNALSSCEAEIMALTLAMQEALWMRGFLTELGLHNSSTPITIHEDNQGAKALAEHYMFSDRSKHIDNKYFKIRDEIRDGTIRLEYCHTSNMLADIFTKPLERPTFENILRKIRMHSEPIPNQIFKPNSRAFSSRGREMKHR